MDRYRRVERPRPETAMEENEIRITTQGLVRSYVNYAGSLLQERQVREIVLKAMGQAISKTVAVAEIIKKRIPWLHQNTTISSISITDVWEPIEEGLVPLETTRHVSMISITLSTRELNKNSPGYQAPFHGDQPKQQQWTQQAQHRQQLPYQTRQPRNQFAEEYYGRGRGRGRGGVGGSGRGRYGGYGEYGRYGNNQENGWNSNWGQGRGRGRGVWGYRGAGYGRGRGGESGGRGYGYGRGRIGSQGRGYQGE